MRHYYLDMNGEVPADVIPKHIPIELLDKEFKTKAINTHEE